MANSTISGYTALLGADVADDDLLEIVDTSATANKKITAAENRIAMKSVPATKAQQETGTSAIVTVTPSTQQYHASAAKAWVQFDGTGTPSIRASYNVASITDNGVGDYTINFTVAFSSAAYAFVLSCGNPSAVIAGNTAARPPAAGNFSIITKDSTFTNADNDYISAVFFGDQ